MVDAGLMLDNNLQIHPHSQPTTPQPGDTVIQTEGLTRIFGSNKAVDGLTLEVNAGEIFGFLGHNGAGKTTTVRLLNGLLEPSAGYARVLGLDPVTQGPQLRRYTGVLTESPSLDNRLTAYENLSTFAAIYGLEKNVARARVNQLLMIFGLEDRAKERVAGYSKGMKQRLALARALVHQPDVIFLDEPASGLDPVVTRQLHELILHLSRNEGKTIFLCTHNLDEAQKLCQRVAVLQHGQLLALGTPSQLARTIVSEVRLKIGVDAAQAGLAGSVLARFTDATPEVDASGIAVSGILTEEIPDVVAALVAAEVRVYRVDHDEPTLEDVYFALHSDTLHSGIAANGNTPASPAINGTGNGQVTTEPTDRE
jgi:ABC-2 type transport system ATP-binding protein